jgi:hypothetical protein
MPVISETRICLHCSKPLRGRIDKKFCDDYCRNNYNNHLRPKFGYGSCVRNINNALMKNRKILESFFSNGDEIAKTKKENLLNLGFQFKYSTHAYTTKRDRTYYYCYEYGYLSLDDDWYLIVKRKDNYH